jgi:hypothetical protein
VIHAVAANALAAVVTIIKKETRAISIGDAFAAKNASGEFAEPPPHFGREVELLHFIVDNAVLVSADSGIQKRNHRFGFFIHKPHNTGAVIELDTKDALAQRSISNKLLEEREALANHALRAFVKSAVAAHVPNDLVHGCTDVAPVDATILKLVHRVLDFS